LARCVVELAIEGGLHDVSCDRHATAALLEGVLSRANRQPPALAQCREPARRPCGTRSPCDMPPARPPGGPAPPPGRPRVRGGRPWRARRTRPPAAPGQRRRRGGRRRPARDAGHRRAPSVVHYWYAPDPKLQSGRSFLGCAAQKKNHCLRRARLGRPGRRAALEVQRDGRHHVALALLDGSRLVLLGAAAACGRAGSCWLDARRARRRTTRQAKDSFLPGTEPGEFTWPVDRSHLRCAARRSSPPSRWLASAMRIASSHLESHVVRVCVVWCGVGWGGGPASSNCSAPGYS
jgi:hypothetical protein